jgi:hypothetical protein
MFWERRDHVVECLRDEGVELRCLGQTSTGDPRHPLYVRGDEEPVPWDKEGLRDGK